MEPSAYSPKLDQGWTLDKHSMSFAKSVTVLGGGITGLSAALHLSRRLPVRSGVCINVLERSNRLGGWVCSERVRVIEAGAGDEADILLESGPRTLRPNSKAVLELVSNYCSNVRRSGCPRMRSFIFRSRYIFLTSHPLFSPSLVVHLPRAVASYIFRVLAVSHPSRHLSYHCLPLHWREC